MNRRLNIKGPFGLKSMALGGALIVALLLGLITVSVAAPEGPVAPDGGRLPFAPAAPAGKSTVGDYVWFDNNHNGLQDDGNTGVNGVLVNLYLDSNNSGVLDAGDAYQGSLTTANNPDTGLPGWYDFGTTAPNTYLVQVDPSNFTGAGVLVGYVQTNSTGTQTNVHKAVLVGSIVDYSDADFGYVRASILVEKTPDSQTVVAGSTATFTIRVTNTGGVPLSNVSVTDLLAPNCNRTAAQIGTLQVSPTTPYYYEYTCTVTASADFTNVATASGTPSNSQGVPLPNAPSVTDDDTAAVDVINPKIDVQKTPDSQQVQVGGTATFTIRVQNTGDVALTNVTVADPLAPDCVRTFASLAVGEAQTYTCTLANVQNDFTNVATATGTPPAGPNVTDTDDAVVDMIRPAIDIQKTPDNQQVPPGSTVTFTIRVQNTGDVVLTNVTVADPLAPNCVRTFTSLAVGEAQTYTCTLANVQNDLTNVATVTGTPPTGANVTDTDDAVVDVIRPAIDVQKTPDNQQARVGDTVTFTIRVQNTGDVALTNVTVADPLAPNCVRTFASLAVGEAQTYTCTLANVQNDLTNVATATGTPPVGPNVTDTDDAVVDVIRPAIDIQKTPDLQQVIPGGTATFTIRVENTGDVVLTNVTVADPLAPNCVRTFASLAPGAANAQTYTCTLANVQAAFTNVATATGTPPVGPNVTDNDSAEVVISFNPAIVLVKTVGPSIASQTPDGQVYYIPAPGGTVYYKFTVTNSGDTNLTNVSIVDDALGYICGPFSLPKGQSTTCYSPQVSMTQDRTNIGTATGTPADANFNPYPNQPPVSDTDDAVVDVWRTSLTVEKTLLTQGTVRPGELVQYRIRVRNTGDVYLAVVPLIDSYNPTYLTYGYLGSYSTPVTSNDNVNDGVINWTDLTGPAPGGFNMDLAPNSFFDVFVNFTALADTTGLPNQVTINTARAEGALPDLDGPTGTRPPETTPVPPQEDAEPVEVLNPTGITLAGFAVTPGEGGAVVTWETASEVEIAGFNLLRVRGEEAAQVNADLIVAQFAGGGSGAAYSIADGGLGQGAYAYILEIVKLDGSTERVELGSLTL
jgi:uncharacterized repeat protein (TIGR01451 family)